MKIKNLPKIVPYLSKSEAIGDKQQSRCGENRPREKLIAESDPRKKDIMIALVTQLLK